MESDYRFARTPRWLIGHVVALAFAVLFASLGWWQVQRLDERRAFNTALEERLGGPPIPLPAGEDAAADAGSLEWRRVSVTGTYDPTREVLVIARTNQGRSGHDVLTPLATPSGTVLVNRGWVPLTEDEAPVAAATPPAAEVTVTGVLRQTQRRGSFGPIDPPDGTLDRVARVDLERLQAQFADLYPLWVHLTGQEPTPGPLPVLQPLPDRTDGPHLNYAVQWFVFTAIVLVGYPFVLKRNANRRPRPGRVSE